MTATSTRSIWDELDQLDRTATRVEGGAAPSPQPADIWDELDSLEPETPGAAPVAAVPPAPGDLTPADSQALQQMLADQAAMQERWTDREAAQAARGRRKTSPDRLKLDPSRFDFGAHATAQAEWERDTELIKKGAPQTCREELEDKVLDTGKYEPEKVRRAAGKHELNAMLGLVTHPPDPSLRRRKTAARGIPGAERTLAEQRIENARAADAQDWAKGKDPLAEVPPDIGRRLQTELNEQADETKSPGAWRFAKTAQNAAWREEVDTRILRHYLDDPIIDKILEWRGDEDYLRAKHEKPAQVFGKAILRWKDTAFEVKERYLKDPSTQTGRLIRLAAASLHREAWYRDPAHRGEPSHAFRMTPPEGLGEKIAGVGGGLLAFVVRIGLTSGIVPPAMKGKTLGTALAWEMENTQGPPGEGAIMGAALNTLGKLRQFGKMGSLAGTGATSLVFQQLAAAREAETEDQIIAALIPVALAGLGSVKRVLKAKYGTHALAKWQGKVDLSGLQREMREAALKELNLKPGATQADVKAAWRALMKTTHPDIAGKQAAPKAAAMNAAYQFLSGGSEKLANFVPKHYNVWWDNTKSSWMMSAPPSARTPTPPAYKVYYDSPTGQWMVTGPQGPKPVSKMLAAKAPAPEAPPPAAAPEPTAKPIVSGREAEAPTPVEPSAANQPNAVSAAKTGIARQEDGIAPFPSGVVPPASAWLRVSGTKSHLGYEARGAELDAIAGTRGPDQYHIHRWFADSQQDATGLLRQFQSDIRERHGDAAVIVTAVLDNARLRRWFEKHGTVDTSGEKPRGRVVLVKGRPAAPAVTPAEPVIPAEGKQAATGKGIIVGRDERLHIDRANQAAAAKFIADLREKANQADQQADAATPSKAKRLRQNARAARKDADRLAMELSRAKRESRLPGLERLRELKKMNFRALMDLAKSRGLVEDVPAATGRSLIEAIMKDEGLSAAPQAPEVAPEPAKPPAEAPPPAAEGKPWEMTDEQWKEGAWADYPEVVLLPSEYEGIAKNEGERARDLVYELNLANIETVDTHTKLDEIIIQVSRKDVEAGKAADFLKRHSGNAREEGRGIYLHIPVEKPAKPAKAEKAPIKAKPTPAKPGPKKAEAKAEKPPVKPAPTKPKVEKRPPSRERVRQEAIDTGRIPTDRIDALLTVADAVAETLVRDGKISSTDELFKNVSITGEMPSGTVRVTAGPAGAIRFYEKGAVVVYLPEGADVTTLIHEFAHLFRRTAGEYYPHDLQMLEDWAGVVNGKWTNPAEEKFARAFERYLRTGKAPTSALVRVFRRFKQWLKAIYRKLRGSAIDVKISPEVEALFGKLLGAKETLAEIAEARQLKKLAPRAKKELATLRGDILSWYRQEVRDPIEEAQVGAAGWLDQEVTTEGQYAVEPTGDFAKRFPGEITDILKDEIIAAGKKPTPAVIRDHAEKKYGLRQNIPGGLAEDYISSIGGAAEYFQRARTRQAKESDLFDQTLPEMDEFAKGTYNEDMAYKIARYRHLQDAGADLLLDEQRTGKRLTIKPEVGEPPPLNAKVAAEAEETLKQYNLLGEEIVKPLTKGKTAELIGKGEVAEKIVGEVEITDELRQEAVKYFLGLPKKAKAEAKTFYMELREQYGPGAADLFNDYTNPMAEVREALLRAEKGGALFGPEAEGPPAPDVLFQARETGIPVKTQRALNNVAITTAEGFAKRGNLTFAWWEAAVTRKVRALAPTLAMPYRAQLDTVWHAIKQGTLEHGEKTQLPYGIREKMQDFFAVQKILARRIAKTERQEVVRAAEKISRPATAGEIRAAVRGEQDAGKEARKLLNAILGREERGARRAWLESARTIVEEHKFLAAYARKMLRRAELTPAQVDRLTQLVTRARTPSEKARVIAAIQEVAAAVQVTRQLRAVDAIAKLLAKYSKQSDFEIGREAETLIGSLRPLTPLAAISRHLAAVSRRLTALGRPLAEGSPARDLLDSMAELQQEYGDANLRDLPPHVIQQVLDAAHDVVFQEGRHNDLLVAQKAETQEEARNSALTALAESHKALPETPAWFRRAVSATRLAIVYTGDSLDIVEYDLFGKANSARDIFYTNPIEAERAFVRYNQEANQHFAKEMGDAKGMRKAERKMLTVTLGGRQVKLRGKYLASLYGTLLNPDIRWTVEESPEGRTFRMSDRKGYKYSITSEDIATIEDKTPDVLKRRVDAYFSWYNGRQAGLVDETGMELVGRKVSRENAYPVRIDDAEIPFEPSALMRDFRGRRRIEHLAQFKHRTGGYKTLLIEPVGLVIERSIRHGLTYAAKALPVQDALRLLKHGEFKTAMHKHIPHAGIIMRGIERDLARYQGLGDVPGPFAKVLKKGLRNIYPVALGGKPHIWLGQIASYVNTYTSMKAKYIPKTVFGMRAAKREMIANVPELAARSHASAASIMAPVDIADAGMTAADKALFTKLADFSILPIRIMDTWTITAIYMGAKREIADLQGLKGSALIEAAGQRTLDIVDENQPTWSVLTSSKMSVWAREHPMAKIGLSILFTGQAHKTYNAMRRAWIAGRRGDISKKEATRRIIILGLVSLTVLEALRRLVFQATGMVGDWLFDDEEDFERTAAQKAAARAKQRAGELPEAIARRIIWTWPAARVGEAVISGGKTIFTRATRDLKSGFKEGWAAMTADEREEAAAEGMKAGEHLLRAAGWALGLPTEGPLMYIDIISKDAPGGVYAKDVYAVATGKLDWNKPPERKKIDRIISILKTAGIPLADAQALIQHYADQQYEASMERYKKRKAEYDALPADEKWEKEPKEPSKLQQETIDSYKDRLEARWKGETYTKPPEGMSTSSRRAGSKRSSGKRAR